MPFCSENCIKTFKKLSPLFAPINPKPVVLDYHFFFIDIVGLSDPRLVVAKQKEKIERLNGFIKDCEAYRKTPDDAKNHPADRRWNGNRLHGKPRIAL